MDAFIIQILHYYLSKSELGPCSHCYDTFTNGACEPSSKNPASCVTVNEGRFCSTNLNSYSVSTSCRSKGKLIYNIMVENNEQKNLIAYNKKKE